MKKIILCLSIILLILTNFSSFGMNKSENNSMNYKITHLITGFHEGLAWAEKGLGFSGSYDVVLINKKGEIVYEVGFSENKVDVTPFYNGISVVYKRGGNLSSLPGLIVIDKFGNVVYENSDLYCCGRGEDGNIIAVKKEESFSGIEWKLVIIDNNLQVKDTGLIVDDEMLHSKSIFMTPKNNIINLSDGVYCIGNRIININRNLTILFPKEFTINKIYKSWCNCTISIQRRWGESYEVYNYIAPTSLLKNVNSQEELKDSDYIVKNGGIIINEWNNWQFDDFYGGCVLSKKGVDGIDISSAELEQSAKLCNFNGDIIKEFGKLPDGARYKKFCNSQNNKMVVYMNGADNNGYVALYDEKCEMIYEPVKISESKIYIYGQSEEYVGFDGYAFTKECIVNAKGQKVNIGDDLSDLKVEDNFSHSSTYLYVFISDGYIYYKGKNTNKIASLDGKNIIEEISATYDKNNNLIFDKSIIK